MSRPGATRALAARMTVAMYAATSALVAVALSLSPSDPFTRRLMVLDVIALVITVAVFLSRRRLPVFVVVLAHLLSVGFVVVGVPLFGGGASAVAAASLAMINICTSVFLFPALWSVAYTGVVLTAVWGTLSSIPGVADEDVVTLCGGMVVVAVLMSVLARSTEAAELDTRTGLVNRRGAERELASALRSRRRHTFTLLRVVDLTDVRGVSEHRDATLRDLAVGWSTGRARAGDVLARWDGDDLALLVRGGATAAEEMVRDLQQQLPPGLQVAAGVVEVRGVASAEEVLERAHAGLFAAAAAGSGSIRRWGATTPSARLLRAALERGEVLVHHQPKVSLVDGSTLGSEALVRWQRPDGTLVPLHTWLPLAEVTGLVVEVGRRVLDVACADAAGWPAPPSGRPLTVAVNVAGRELVEPDYADVVRQALARHGLPASRLVVEVVEGVLALDQPTVSDNLRALKEMGVRLAMDDFGTGMSSLSRLVALPLDELKVDRSFTAAVTDVHADAPLVRHTLGIASDMGLAVTVEGVETDAQVRWLQSRGATVAQGFWWSRPLPPAEFADWLREHGAPRPPVPVQVPAQVPVQRAGVRVAEPQP